MTGSYNLEWVLGATVAAHSKVLSWQFVGGMGELTINLSIVCDLNKIQVQHLGNASQNRYRLS